MADSVALESDMGETSESGMVIGIRVGLQSFLHDRALEQIGQAGLAALRCLVLVFYTDGELGHVNQRFVVDW